MTQLIGEYHCKLDAKGRVSLPAALKKQIPTEAEEKFVVNRGIEKCLTLFPKNEWDKEAAKINNLNPYKTNVRKFQRFFFRGATPMELDSASRLNLPNELLAYAGIDKEVVLFAHINKIEIWDKSAYERLFSDDDDSMADMAEEVMGSLNGNDGDND